jgi:hypothetical protein
MLEIQELQKARHKTITRYDKLFKIFLLISILFIILNVLIATGIYIFDMEANWAGLSLDNWIYICCGLIMVFIIFEIFFFIYYIILSDNGLILRKKRSKKEKPKKEFIDGKRVYIYTHPMDAEGGIYSKTYIRINENSVLHLRTLMIPPEDLWDPNK